MLIIVISWNGAALCFLRILLTEAANLDENLDILSAGRPMSPSLSE
jgi:hypothetical protein